MEINNLDFSYQQEPIFKDLSVNFSDKTINAIIGVNGAGKSTLLDIIAGLYTKTTNNYLSHFPDSCNIMYQLQHTTFFPTLTVEQTLDLFRKIDKQDDPVNNRIMKEVYEKVIGPLMHIKMGMLSGGERQMVITYGICLLNRELYLFDEPLSGVDVRNSELIMKLITSLNTDRNKKVILTLHQLEYLKDTTVNIVFIDQQRCIFEGSFKEILNNSQTTDIDAAFKRLTK
ncbi:ATP-binding cassette domain-containing protein [Latilactobacillus curvatus]|uniref:ATP-binding cassette domain-containing protein n=1 Tax=Latilactobacillus curvatus TaxID=28038 RepID=UPI0020C7D382|nr:ATP-binding cassette domain-containing protein [Latilactobacillus curvatus]MCP8848878.1 ATP-binding cassette domain-containing protein [Latilactobacillus curvatus]MCP8865690.1 ATP-binding cassette domain-containing protein [Latilactobacillus curvatus]MCP8874567.1 ATP-binding cassette domain-containing protein [Latilactobacillus curvatus]MCP8876362.1 ATP-binding cassette domain-containing protein [Latilactobacillus curvatus]MCP8879958.1 ATP-binding cassette domain-containing protein [Latilac